MIWVYLIAVFSIGILLGFVWCAVLTSSKVAELEEAVSSVLTAFGVTQADLDQAMEQIATQEEQQ